MRLMNTAAGGDLAIDGFNGLIDEVYIYDVALTSSQLKELAGRSYFDLSGNKRHAIPIGDDLDMSSPDTMDGSDTDVPTPANHNKDQTDWVIALPVKIMVIP